jgi:CRISPR-associated protein Csb2
MLQLQIGFPAGRYYAADHADPRQPEWPPHPSRVFSALVAAAYAGGRQPTPAERQALAQLEAAGDPALVFPRADLRPAADSYVPVNDPKTRIDARKGQSQGVLHPNRQVRQFPSAFLLGEPDLRIVWPIEPDDGLLEALDALARRMTHLGTSHTFVTASASRVGAEATGSAALVPDPDGQVYLRVPRRGRLAELDMLARQGHGTLRRPTPACETLVPFGPPEAAGREALAAAHDWVCLRLTGASWGADTSHTLARAFRAAVMSLLGDAAPPAVHGHDPAQPHAAWLPLPDVGHPFARGRIRGMAVGLPRQMADDERAQVLAGLAKLHKLHLPDGQVADVTPEIEGPDTLAALRRATWCAASTEWSTVTPVLLDRPPKRTSAESVAASVVQSLRYAGLPEPVALHVASDSDFTGAPSTHDIPTRVPRFHVRVRFAQAVRGPVLAGRWRHFGVGLFRPTPSSLHGGQPAAPGDRDAPPPAEAR